MLKARRKVLVVDDELAVRMLVADVLDEAGFEVIEAPGAGAAIQCLGSNAEVQVLFTDINMPGMDGLELARQVHARWPEIALVVASGNERPEDEEIADRGVFVAKPFRPGDIVAAVQRAITQH